MAITWAKACEKRPKTLHSGAEPRIFGIKYIYADVHLPVFSLRSHLLS